MVMSTDTYWIAEDAQLDAGIRRVVSTLHQGGVETFESCKAVPATLTWNRRCDSVATAARAIGS